MWKYAHLAPKRFGVNILENNEQFEVDIPTVEDIYNDIAQEVAAEKAAEALCQRLSGRYGG